MYEINARSIVAKQIKTTNALIFGDESEWAPHWRDWIVHVRMLIYLQPYTLNSKVNYELCNI